MEMFSRFRYSGMARRKSMLLCILFIFWSSMMLRSIASFAIVATPAASRRKLGLASLLSLYWTGLGPDSATALTGSATVNEFLEAVDVYAVTDASGSPIMEEDSSSKKMVGRFFLDEEAASKTFSRLKDAAKAANTQQSLEIRKVPLAEVYLPFIVDGDEAKLGGKLMLEPELREVRHAQQILQGADLGPPGSVPLFLCPTLELAAANGITFIPIFLREADLRSTLKKAGGQGSEVEITTLQSLTTRLGNGLLAVQDAVTNDQSTPPVMRLIQPGLASNIKDTKSSKV
eukprot:TRINITY_DN4804_c0_g2_i1.p1 TRINITY_DN4804_c0_g2~~TRINITY_DN4804_c0_g2_i1.p1  ORF type:complete len:288 (+),score=46.61 TRINITY_DN4804_c0_g2_i1:438-1301(+)